MHLAPGVHFSAAVNDGTASAQVFYQLSSFLTWPVYQARPFFVRVMHTLAIKPGPVINLVPAIIYGNWNYVKHQIQVYINVWRGIVYNKDYNSQYRE